MILLCKQAKELCYNWNMQSSDNQQQHSEEIKKLKNISYHELDENSINKPNLEFRNQIKHVLSNETKTMAVQLLKRIQLLEHKLDVLESKQVEFPRKKKKIRRKAREIPRIYKCMFSNCGKQYGSEASLKNHRKIKHGVRLIRKCRPHPLKALQKVEQ